MGGVSRGIGYLDGFKRGAAMKIRRDGFWSFLLRDNAKVRITELEEECGSLRAEVSAAEYSVDVEILKRNRVAVHLRVAESKCTAMESKNRRLRDVQNALLDKIEKMGGGTSLWAGEIISAAKKRRQPKRTGKSNENRPS